jgi:hypothetical protein
MRSYYKNSHKELKDTLGPLTTVSAAMFVSSFGVLLLCLGLHLDGPVATVLFLTLLVFGIVGLVFGSILDSR